MAQPSQNNFEVALGRLVVDRGLATQQEIEDCLALRQHLSGTGTSPGEETAISDESAAGSLTENEDTIASQQSLADLLVSNGVITERQLKRVLPQIEISPQPKHDIPGFRLYGRLGAGAMATVYKARQLSLDRIVAIKVLPRKFMTNPSFIERFYAEGRAAARLNHANIVQAIDVGQAGETHYFVMEYVEGRTVYDDITNKGRYTEEGALKIALQIADALEHAHEAGLIHRDVKPKNIMITKEGTAKLADMGLARAASDTELAESEKGKAYGTPYYISPEQIRGQVDVDFRADIYSFGATLYHMVTGQVPYDGPNPSAVMHKHLKADLEPPDHINEKLSNGFSEIIEVCMAKESNKRYNNTADLVEDLKHVSRGEPPVHARQKFDLAKLNAIAGPDMHNMVTLDPDEVPPITDQPLFWVAAFGWVAFVIVLIMLLLISMGSE